MAIAIGVSTKGRTASATSIATGTVTTQAAGSIIVGGMVFQGTFSSYTDNKSNSPFVQIDSERIVDTTNSAKLRGYYFKNAAGGSGHTTTAATTTSQPITNVMAEITGADTSSPLVASNGGNDTSSPYGNAVSITPPAGNLLLLAIFGGNSGSNPATQAETQGFTILTSAQETDGATFWTACMAYKLVTANGSTAYTAQFTESGASEGAVILAAFKELATTASDGAQRTILLLGRGPGVSRFQPATRGFANPATDVSVALSGSVLTLNSGILVPASSLALTGQQLGGAAGILVPGTSKTLSGSALASASGTLTPGASIPLTGSALASASGTLVPALAIALTGLQINFGQGNLSAPGNVTAALSGVLLVSATGTLVPATSKALSGSALSMSTGTLTPTLARALSGNQLATVTGTLISGLSVSITGNLLALSPGTLTVLDQSADQTPATIRRLTVHFANNVTVEAPGGVTVNAPGGATVH